MEENGIFSLISADWDDMDDLDFSTKQSRLVTAVLNTIKIEDSPAIISRWLLEARAWLLLHAAEADVPDFSLPAKRDDRLTALACYAACISVKLVKDELCLDRSYHYCGAKRTVKCIRKAVLACFKLLCKNLLIEKSWDAVSLRDSMIKGEYVATYYLNLHSDQLNFQLDEEQEKFLLLSFYSEIMGIFGRVPIFSEIQPSTRAMDDDIVGLSNGLTKIKERLLRSQAKLDIIPIVGMGGIGKTTLTRKVYEEPEIMRHFHVRAWVVVSQKFCERDVLLGLLESIAPLPHEVYKKDTGKLAQILYQRLKGWRYFIVLDDIWTTEPWDHIKVCFPDDGNGSRIVLTSRITEVASHVDRVNLPHFMNFLGIDESWELLRKKVYGKNACPRELINIGKQIAKKCQGLPLAIEVMAGHLSNCIETKECWEDIAKRMVFETEVTHMESLSNILSLSYNDLSHHLKACFLTMVNFPKNMEIPVRKLIQLWLAMGFLPQKLPNSMEESTMEEVAMKYLKALIDRCLIMVKKRKFDGTAKLCGIHDLLWDLSMGEFRKEGHSIFCYKSFCDSDFMNVCDDDKKYVIDICQTLLYFDQSFESDYPINSEGFKQLRMLDILNQAFDYFPVEIFGLVNLIYLALSTSDNIPDLICNLSNLETLVNYHEGAGHMLPKEIWLLAHLRHLQVGTCTYLSQPPSVGFEGSSEPLLPNLQSLSYLSFSCSTKEVLMNIPNLKQLGISESEGDDNGDDLLCRVLENLVILHQLEKLKLRCNSELERPRRIPRWDSFLSNTIKELTLSGCNLPWSEMNALAILPNLEVLKLKNDAFQGEEWEMEDEEFLKLKYLLLDSVYLTIWKANCDNFPNLQCLCIWRCPGLFNIPIGFGELFSLELIDLDFCNQAVFISAVDILREQQNLGNYKLILHVGHKIPFLQTVAFFVLFIWLPMKLKDFKRQRDYPKKNTMKLNILKLHRDYRKRNKRNPSKGK